MTTTTELLSEAIGEQSPLSPLQIDLVKFFYLDEKGGPGCGVRGKAANRKSFNTATGREITGDEIRSELAIALPLLKFWLREKGIAKIADLLED